MHVKLQAMKALCEILERETGCKVFRGRQVVGKDISLPFLNISENIRPADSRPASDSVLRKDGVDLLISGYIATDDVDNPIDNAYDIIMAMEQAFTMICGIDRKSGNPISKDDYNLGGLVKDFKYQPSICHNPADDVQSHAYFYFPVSYLVVYDATDAETSLINK